MRRLCQLLTLLLCSLPLLHALPDWAVTSWIGVSWGTLLLTGLSAVWTKRRLAYSAYAMLTASLAHASLCATTDLGRYAGWLVVATLLACGWVMGIMLLPWRDDQRVPGVAVIQDQSKATSLRFSVWDIFCATTLAAMFCWIIPRTENQFDLLCRVAPALVGGIVLSLLALQWAWKDEWSISSMLSILVSLPMVALLIMPWALNLNSFADRLVWIVSGPLSVMAAQFIVVLLWVATLRTRERELSPPAAQCYQAAVIASQPSWI